MYCLPVFLTCLLITKAVVSLEAQAVDGIEEPRPRAARISPKIPLSKKPFSDKLIVRLDPIINQTVESYLDEGSSLWQKKKSSHWHIVLLEEMWQFITLQKPNSIVVPLTLGERKKLSPQVKIKDGYCHPHEDQLTFAFLVGVTQSSCWNGAELKDAAAFVEKVSGFKKGELQGITSKTLRNSLAYQSKLGMVLGRLMGYQIASGVAVEEGLGRLEALYDNTVFAQQIQMHRTSSSVNLEAMFTRINERINPLSSKFRLFFAGNKQRFTGISEGSLWEEKKGEEIPIYLRVLQLDKIHLCGACIYELSQAFKAEKNLQPPTPQAAAKEEEDDDWVKVGEEETDQATI